MTAGLLIWSWLWIADTLLTLTFVQHLGVEFEANPIMRWLIETAGPAGFMMVKLALMVMWVWIMALYHTTQPKRALILIWTMLVLMLPVVYMGWALASLS